MSLPLERTSSRQRRFPERGSLSLHAREKPLHVLLVAQNRDLLTFLAPSEVGEHRGPYDPSVGPDEVEEPWKRPVEGRRLTVRGHLRAVRAVQPALGDAPDAGQGRDVHEDDRVRGVEPEVGHQLSLLNAVRDPRLALDLAQLDRVPLGIRSGHPARPPVEPVEVNHRQVEEVGELPPDPGLARAGRAEECDAPHSTGLNQARENAMARARWTWVYDSVERGGTWRRGCTIRGDWWCGRLPVPPGSHFRRSGTSTPERSPRSGGRRRFSCPSSG